MATKVKTTIPNLLGDEEVTVYQEGELFLYNEQNCGWGVFHMNTKLSVCDGYRWEKKREALDYAIKLQAYEENGKKIDWKATNYRDFYQFNDEKFIVRAFEECMK